MERKRQSIMIAVVLLAMMTVGCNEKQIEKLQAASGKTAVLMEKANSAIDQLVAREAELQTLLDTLPEGQLRAKAKAELEDNTKTLVKYKGLRDQIVTTAKELDVQLAEAEDGLDVADSILNAASGVIPPPWGAVVSIGGGLIVGLLRSRKVKKDAMTMARAINPVVEAAIEADPGVADKIRAVASAGSRSLVRDAKNGGGLPF